MVDEDLAEDEVGTVQAEVIVDQLVSRHLYDLREICY